MARHHDRTSSSSADFVTAYRAAGRAREADIVERIENMLGDPRDDSRERTRGDLARVIRAHEKKSRSSTGADKASSRRQTRGKSRPGASFPVPPSRASAEGLRQGIRQLCRVTLHNCVVPQRCVVEPWMTVLRGPLVSLRHSCNSFKAWEHRDMAKRHNRTNSSRPDFAAAYHADARTREAETAERAASASTPPKEASLLSPELLELCRQLKVVQDHARSLGIFVGDRDLLSCEWCGLEENILITGELITTQAGHYDPPDIGLRFVEIATNTFECPRCRNEVALDENPFDLGGGLSDDAP